LQQQKLPIRRRWAGEASGFPPRLATVLASMRVSRNDFAGPVFSVMYEASFLPMENPIKETLMQKLAASYVCHSPIELVFYIDGLAFCSGLPHMWLQPLAQLLDGHHGLGPFRRIWLVDLIAEKIEFVTPKAR
jgi:hypothetical protein